MWRIRSVLSYLTRTNTYLSKILSMTCNNASANDAMMDELEFTLVHFEGQATRVRCILHVGNLVAKCIIKQFDVPCKQEGKDHELHALAEGLSAEDYEMISMIGADPNNLDVDSWVDEITRMNVQDRANLEQSIQLVRMALTKVSTDSPYSPQTHLILPDS